MSMNYDCQFEKGTSSFVKGFSYSVSDRSLIVDFLNGAAYKYEKVPATIPAEFLIAESKGKFLHEKLKGKYDGKAIIK